MFDSHRHFASTFPQMAKSAPHLRYSILALSARQMERKQNEKSQSESLSLYQEAIHLLLPELESKSTPVIASCVILCVLEMLSCMSFLSNLIHIFRKKLLSDVVRQPQRMAPPSRRLRISHPSSRDKRLFR